jgi:hypothetical protein
MLLMSMDTVILLLRIADQLKTEKIMRIQATVELTSAKTFNYHSKTLDCLTAIVNRLRAKLDYIKAFVL